MKQRPSSRRHRYSEALWRYAVVPAAIWGVVVLAAALGGLLDSAAPEGTDRVAAVQGEAPAGVAERSDSGDSDAQPR
jgi:hypothetical protein